MPELYSEVKRQIPGLTLVIAGTGPAEANLREALPDARFLGWIDHHELPAVYSSADLLVLPSRFDTFSCVVLEAISLRTACHAYETKGPRDILQNEVNGYLVKTRDEMASRAISFLFQTANFGQP